MIKIQEPIFDGGKDVMTTVATLDYDPKVYSTKEEAAMGLYVALRKAAKEYGQNPDSEVHISKDCLHVSWEAGPYDLAIPASFEITGPWGFTEPYYGFDLTFTE
jgi:hypothetical protein